MSSMLLPDLNSKAKQKAMVDAQLKDAISALKKPNRELVGKALADEIAEKRSSTSASRARSEFAIPMRSKRLTVQRIQEACQKSTLWRANHCYAQSCSPQRHAF